MTTLLNALDDTGKTIGLESMCVGGGQGMAMIVERLSLDAPGRPATVDPAGRAVRASVRGGGSRAVGGVTGRPCRARRQAMPDSTSRTMRLLR